MTATLARLVKSGKEIIFFIAIPELGFDPALCLKPRLFSTVERKQDCKILKEDFKKRNADYISTVTSVLKAFPTVKVFEQSKYLCDEKYCHARIDGKMIYRDDDHLSYEGSRFMSEKFRQEFNSNR